MARFHLAQLNVGRAKAPLDSPELAEFMALLDPINALADRTPGFVWRLQDEEGTGATAIKVSEDDQFIVNMSVWESIEALWAFVYDSAHLDVMRRRREWFERHVEAFQVLWWVPAGHIPTTAEALAKLETLRERGPTPDAFTFKVRFEPDAGEPRLDDRDLCPA
ncbi:MAG: DUF3291 domain-containing protein [Actinomycetota bacterium]|nr:DUF3291 domain-containing protein [Actinomycetota bacterium]